MSSENVASLSQYCEEREVLFPPYTLLELAERSAIGRNGPPALELNVHAANADARAAYERLGFAQTSSQERGRVLVMRRKR